MALVPTRLENSLQELGIDRSVESLGQYLDAQKGLFYNQVEQLQRLVVTQCKLTGVNPLSQEMAAGALSIKIGKKHRDMLNPKAVKYMQSVFAIKDTIGKKETREISALCGVTVTQVRDFFSGQRAKVRKLISFAREKALRSDASDATTEGCPVNPEAALFCTSDTPASDADIKNVAELSTSNWKLPAFRCCENAPASSIDAKTVQVATLSSSSQEECMLAMDEDDKKILENIFNLMWKEGTFSGQVKLMEWILQIHNSAVLVWFLTKGCIAILATWLSEAAIEEQTTVLNVILKVLCHLPLHKALPAQMSTILQTVNKLRFYRTQDISNRAKVLLSRWSKMLVRNHALKHPSSTLNSSNGVQKDIIRKQRINEILSDEFWRSKIGITEEILSLTENSGNDSKSDPKQALKLLTASCDSSNKKQGQSASSIKIKERRKVLLVEQLDQKPSSGRIAQAGKAPSAANHSRPLSADDIQKAKMRAMFMQHKYGKADSPSAAENKRTEVNKEVRVPQSKKDLPAPVIIMQQTLVNREEGRWPVNGLETPASTPFAGDLRQELSEMLRGGLLHWRMPPEIKLDSSWRVGEGESSKEIGIQVQRIRREKETFYSSKFDVPPNAKEPWDVEMDYDDSLTPEIPTQQLPDSDPTEEPAVPSVDVQQAAVLEDMPPALSAPSVVSAAAAPDLELLAILLQNPELVFALTSGQGRNLTSDERVALLDMIKHNNTATLAKEPPHPASLPSPTPPSDAERAAGWRTLAFSATPTGAQTSAVTVKAATQILGSAPSAESALLSKNYGTTCSQPAMASFPQDSYGRSNDTLLMRDLYTQASLSHTQEDELLLQSRSRGSVVGVYEDFYPTHRNAPTGREETAVCRFAHSEAWSPECANVRSSRFWQGQGQGNAEKWPRQQRSGFGGRWRDRDQNRDWDHRR